MIKIVILNQSKPILLIFGKKKKIVKCSFIIDKNGN